MLAGYAAVALALILNPSGGLFSDATRPGQRPLVLPQLSVGGQPLTGLRARV